MAAAVMLVSAGCVGRATTPAVPRAGAAPVVFHVLAGQMGESARADVSGFFPSQLAARPGDTLRFSNPTLGTPHTVLYGVAEDRANEPAPVIEQAQPNPADVEPCIAAAAPVAGDRACPTPAPATQDGSLVEPFAGQPFYSAGLVRPDATVEVRLAPSVPPGRYLFRCAIHLGMDLTVDVRGPNAAVPSAAAVDAAGRAEAAAAVAAVRTLPVRAGAPGEITVGGSSGRATIDRFGPEQLTVRAGSTVTWRNTGPAPHTVVFGLGPPSGELLSAAATPAGGGAAVDAAPGAFVYSGWIGAGLIGRPAFRVRFLQPGRYPFRCSLHPGMSGVVVVV